MKKINARIIKGIGGFYYCNPIDSSFLLQEKDLIECKPKGLFRYQKIKPQVGDFVTLVKENNEWVITEIKDRKNTLIRPSISNVDKALICVSVKSPKPNLLLLDQLILNCFINDIAPIICITKVDLDLTKAKELKEIYQKLNIPVYLLSTEQEDEIELLINELSNTSAFLAGNSGVGKSSLSNRLCLTQMDTGNLSQKLDRGKHTTRHIELLKTLYNGYLLDTPGFSTLELDEKITPENLKFLYPEFKDSQCFYSNCNHIKEPKCGVREKVKNKEIDINRYKRYKKLFELVKSRSQY